MRTFLGFGASLVMLATAAIGNAAGDAAAKVAAADAAKGAKVYGLYCATCHGPTGGGDGALGKTLDPRPRNFQKGDFKYGGDDAAIFDVISNGAASRGGSPLMAPWGAVVPEADRWALVKFIHSLKK